MINCVKPCRFLTPRPADATARPILDVLAIHFRPNRRTVLEIGSGADGTPFISPPALPHLTWRASDRLRTTSSNIDAGSTRRPCPTRPPRSRSM
ncbi:MAG: class I SAM-dependent methyltransferase [Rhodocyclaceae bacterium]|nr:class I SAM-dependent methyltransferase [Rhodocyclaceae bacterium]